VAMMGQTLAPAPPTAEQTVLPISAIIWANKKTEWSQVLTMASMNMTVF
jgi:hypothetical protein